MKGSMCNLKRASVAALALGLTLSAQWAWAGPKIQSIGTTRVNGSVETNVNSNRDPWVAQVFSSGNECLRIAVVSQGADLEATLISPSGRVWQDDDSNGSLRPLIKAITDVRGWYPLTLSHFAGAVTNADFSMDITRLPSNSASCQPPTAPRVLEPQQKATGNLGPAPAGGANN
jgi:hypothetical protein